MYISIDTSDNIKTNQYDKWYGYTKFDVINKIINKQIDKTQVISQTNKASAVTNSFALKDITESRSPIKFYFDAIESMSDKENNNISPIIHIYEISLFKDEKNLTRVPNNKLVEVQDSLKKYLDDGMSLFNERMRDENAKGDLFKQVEDLKIQLHHIDKEKEKEKHTELLTQLNNLANTMKTSNPNIKIKMEYDIKIKNNRIFLEMPSLGKLVNTVTGDEKYYLMSSKNLSLYMEPSLKQFSTFSQTFELGHHKNNMEKLNIEYNDENYIEYLKENKIKKNTFETSNEEEVEVKSEVKVEEVKVNAVKDFLGVSQKPKVESTTEVKQVVTEKQEVKVETPKVNVKNDVNLEIKEVTTLDVSNINDKNELEKSAMEYVKTLETPLEENAKNIDEQVSLYKKEEEEFRKQEEEFRRKQEEFKKQQQLKKEQIENSIFINTTLEKQNNVIKTLTLSNLELKEKYNELEIIKDNALDENIELEDTITKLEEALDKTVKTNSELNDTVEELKTDNQKLNENVEFLDTQIEEKDKLIETKDNEIEGLQTLDSENKKVISGLENSLTESNNKNVLLTKENTELTSKNAEQKELLDNYKGLITEFKTENSKIKSENSLLNSTNQELNNELKALREELEKTRKRELEKNSLIESLQEENANYKAVTESLTDELSRKNSEISNNEQIITEQKEEIFLKGVEVSSKDKVIEEISEKLSKTNAELEKKDVIIKDLNNELVKRDVVSEQQIKEREEMIHKNKMSALKLEEEVNRARKEKANPNEFLNSVTKHIESLNNMKP